MDYEKIIKDEKELFVSRGLQMSSRSQLLINLSYDCIHKDTYIHSLRKSVNTMIELRVNPPIFLKTEKGGMISEKELKHLRAFKSMTFWERIKWALRGEV